MCYVSIRHERHSYDIIKKNKEFVINLVSENLTAITDWCGVRSGKKYNKFETMAITPITAEKVKAPLIDESPVNIECAVKDIIPLGSHDMFIADILAIHAREDFTRQKVKTL
jgi:flavin reductase (DIM6/NTAB) family NADH-FMN oxidoreductase RutF